MLLLLLAAALYLNRRAAARELLVGWLDRRGIDADVEVERLELSGFVGRIVIGDPRDPDIRVERVEVDYALAMPWSEAGLGVTPSRIRLVRPVAKARWTKGRLSMGRLDPLIDEFLARPRAPRCRGRWSSSRADRRASTPNTAPCAYWPTPGSTTASSCACPAACPPPRSRAAGSRRADWAEWSRRPPSATGPP
jgi:hypothetical protein